MDMTGGTPNQSRLQPGNSSSVPLGTAGRTRYLQDRLGLFALIGLALVSFLTLTSNLIWLLFLRGETDPWLCAQRVGNLPDFLHIITLVSAWRLCRMQRDFSIRTLLALDLGLMVLLATGIALSMTMVDPLHPASPLFGLLGLSIALTSRAVVVPSTPRFTSLVSALSLLPLAYVFGFGKVELNLVMRDAGEMTSLANVGIWAVMIASVPTIASQVIYGLRRKVTQARQLGQYHLETKLGAGGMGEVYRASHAMLRRPTAIKLMRVDVGGCEGVQRFEREVQSTSALTHPNTIAIYDYGQTPDGVFYYAMELLDGVDLEQLVLRRGPLPTERVIYLLTQVCGSLAEAHSKELIHRDIKPANIFVCRRGGRHDVVKVLDFGLVKDLVEDNGLTLNAGIQVMGTPRYMSPESVSDLENVDPRSDIYSLGCVAYFLLTGTPPFEGSSAIEVLGKHLHTKPQNLSERAGRPIPDDISNLVLSCLSKNRDHRPASIEAVEEELLRCRDANSWGERQARDWWQKFGNDLGIPAAVCEIDLGSGSLANEGTIRLDIGNRMPSEEWYDEFDTSSVG